MMGEPRWKTNRPRPRFVNKLQLLPKMLYGNIASLPIYTFKMQQTFFGSTLILVIFIYDGISSQS